MFTLWTILSLASSALAVWYAIQLLARDLPPTQGAASPPAEAAGLWSGAPRQLLLAVAIAAALLFLGSKEQGLGWQASIACALGAFASAGASSFGLHCAARMQRRDALRALLGTAVAGIGLGGVAVLLLLFGPDRSQNVLGFALGAGLSSMLVRSGGLAAVTADLFQSQAGAILAAVLVGGAVAGTADDGQLARLSTFPLILAAAGIGACHLGAMLARSGRLRLGAGRGGRLAAVAILLAVMALMTWWMSPTPIGAAGAVDPWSVYAAMLIGVLLAPTLGKLAEQSSSPQMAPAQELAQHSQDGPTANLVHGLATGMASTWGPALLLAFAVWGSSELAGFYGICIAAVGALSTLATSPAFAIGEAAVAAADRRARASSAAALTTMAWFAVFCVQSRAGLDLRHASVVAGLLIGTMLPFLLAALLARVDCGGAGSGPEATASPRRRLAPGLCAVAIPVLTGMVFGKAAAGGLLIAAFAVGFVLALVLANTAGAWAGAKDYVETGHLGGKDGPTHAAAGLGAAAGQRWQDLRLHALVLLAAIATVLGLPLFR